MPGREGAGTGLAKQEVEHILVGGQPRLRVCVLECVSITPPGGTPQRIGSLQQKIMLTLVVAYPDRSVSVDRIADELWGEHRPPCWLPGIRTLANNLRRKAGDRNFIHWTGRGYRLHRDENAVETDIERMVRFAGEARVALEEHRFDDAEVAARRALSCYGSGPWTTDAWYWGDLAAEAYVLLGQALLAKADYLACLLELSRAPEELEGHDGLRTCLDRAKRATVVAV